MSARRKKTVLRTIRLTQELDDLLQKDAQAKGISVNAFINGLMMKYVEWDRYINKFSFISIASETFKSILNVVDNKKLENIAKDLGSEMPKAVAMFWFKKLNLETSLNTITLFGKYSGLHANEIEFNEGNYIITFHHNLGEKWSTFLRHFISQFISSAVGIIPQTDATSNLVIASFRVPTVNAKGSSELMQHTMCTL
jgi:uncharacterized protein (DUF1778 family)